MRVVSLLHQAIAALILLGSVAAHAESDCKSHYRVLGVGNTTKIYEAINGALGGRNATVIVDGYTVTAVKTGKCSVEVRMVDQAGGLVCSEKNTLGTDDLSPEEVERLRQKGAEEELKRQEAEQQMRKWDEEGKRYVEEKQRIVEEYQKQQLSGIPPEYIKDPEHYFPGLCQEYRAELKRIQSCQNDSDCGQVLQGTSCGCSRDSVARKLVDTSRFYQLQKTTMALFSIAKKIPKECSEVAVMSTCDCPETDGFACINNTCRWKYLPPIVYYSVPPEKGRKVSPHPNAD